MKDFGEAYTPRSRTCYLELGIDITNQEFLAKVMNITSGSAIYKTVKLAVHPYNFPIHLQATLSNLQPVHLARKTLLENLGRARPKDQR
jgi:hypothetical protein